jgi:osmoprotectant transport system permease protein
MRFDLPLALPFGAHPSRSLPRLAGIAWTCALALALFGLPVLSIAENRLALGRPVLGAQALGWQAGLILALGVAGLVVPSRQVARWRTGFALAVFALTILVLGAGLGQGAAQALAGFPPAARARLDGGAWLALALLAGGLGLALRRARAPWLGPATVAALVLGIVLMARSGGFDALSLAVEYAARRQMVNAAIAEHLALSGAALALALAGAVLLSLWRRGQGLVSIVLSGIQVVPAVALLGGLVAMTGGLLRAVPALRDLGLSALGAVPAIVAIAAYLLLPLWRGLALGLRSPDAATLEAAAALGLTPAQALFGVRLPLGAPVLVAALRVAAVQAIGLATLGALVGAGGLGRIVFDGMAQFAPDLILLGAIPVIALSLGAEIGLSRIEAAARRRWHA